MKNPSRLHKTIRKKMEKAILEYKMIEKGDSVLVGVSGGQDSLTLLQMLYDRSLFIDQNFNIIAVHIDLGFKEEEPATWQILKEKFEELNVKYRIIHTKIAESALNPEAKKNPCFICSHYRRKMIYETAHQEKCSTIAYGHHKDDIIETLLINILYGRKIEAMNPNQEIFDGRMKIIRPFIYIYENSLKKLSAELNIPHIKSPCPVDGKTKRDKIKKLLKQFQQNEKNANIKENIFKSLHHINISEFSPLQKK